MRAVLEKRVRFMELNSFLKRVLKRFFGASEKQHADIAPGTNPIFELLSRFIFHSGHFSKNRPKPSAFLPPATVSAISVFWIDTLAEDEIWKIGRDVAAGPTGRTVLARADFAKDVVASCELAIEIDSAPHQRHVNLCGW